MYRVALGTEVKLRVVTGMATLQKAFAFSVHVAVLSSGTLQAVMCIIRGIYVLVMVDLAHLRQWINAAIRSRTQANPSGNFLVSVVHYLLSARFEDALLMGIKLPCCAAGMRVAQVGALSQCLSEVDVAMQVRVVENLVLFVACSWVLVTAADTCLASDLALEVGLHVGKLLLVCDLDAAHKVLACALDCGVAGMAPFSMARSLAAVAVNANAAGNMLAVASLRLACVRVAWLGVRQGRALLTTKSRSRQNVPGLGCCAPSTFGHMSVFVARVEQRPSTNNTVNWAEVRVAPTFLLPSVQRFSVPGGVILAVLPLEKRRFARASATPRMVDRKREAFMLSVRIGSRGRSWRQRFVEFGE